MIRGAAHEGGGEKARGGAAARVGLLHLAPESAAPERRESLMACASSSASSLSCDIGVMWVRLRRLGRWVDAWAAGKCGERRGAGRCWEAEAGTWMRGVEWEVERAKLRSSF